MLTFFRLRHHHSPRKNGLWVTLSVLAEKKKRNHCEQKNLFLLIFIFIVVLVFIFIVSMDYNYFIYVVGFLESVRLSRASSRSPRLSRAKKVTDLIDL
jgi:Flp pilus assembly protein TadB